MVERRLARLEDFVPIDRRTEDQQGKEQDIILFGILLYEEGKRMILLGGYPSGALFSLHQDTQEEFTVEGVQEGRERIISLKEYDTITVAQVNLGAVSVTTYPSILHRPTVNVNIRFTPSADHDASEGQQKFTSNHDDFLRIFTGEQGGLVVFHGNDMPEDIGILFEKRVGVEKHGFLFFVSPDLEENLRGLHSIDGFDGLLRRLNEEFITKLPLPTQQQALQALDEAIAKRELRFSSPQRKELLRTIIIAHAQLAEHHPDKSHAEFLKTVIKRGWIVDRPYKMEIKQDRLNQAIDALILPRKQAQAVSMEPAPAQKKESSQEKFYFNLDGIIADRVQKMGRVVNEYVGKKPFYDRLIQVYFADFLDYFNGANDFGSLHDAEILLRQLRCYYNWDYYRYEYKREDAKITLISLQGDNSGTGIQLDHMFSDLQAEIVRRRLELIKEQDKKAITKTGEDGSIDDQKV